MRNRAQPAGVAAPGDVDADEAQAGPQQAPQVSAGALVAVEGAGVGVVLTGVVPRLMMLLKTLKSL
jgi:hypothetical protein